MKSLVVVVLCVPLAALALPVKDVASKTAVYEPYYDRICSNTSHHLQRLQKLE